MRTIFQKVPLFLAIVFFILSCFIFFYLYKTIDSNNKSYALEETKWQAEEIRRSEISTLDYSIKIIANERAELQTHFAESSDVVPFLDTVEGLGPKVGVDAQVVSVDTPTDNTGLLVGMKASGSFGNLYKFLTLLENSSYELEFVSMDIQKRGTSDTAAQISSGVWNLTFKMKLLTFVN